MFHHTLRRPMSSIHPFARGNKLGLVPRPLGGGASHRLASTPFVPRKTNGLHGPWTVPSGFPRSTTRGGPYRIWAGSGREKGQFPATVRVPRGENPRDFGVERSASWRSFPRKRRPSGMFWVRMKTRQHGLVSPAPDPARPCFQDRPRSNTDRRDPRNVSDRIRTRDIIPRRAMVEDEKKDGDRAVPKSPGYDGIYRRG